MKLQIALDDLSMRDAQSLLDKVSDYVDIIEIGSPFIIAEGMHAVKRFRADYPTKEILADTKIMDAGEYESELTYLAGADYCTVLGVTDIRTIQACLKSAAKHGRKVFVDMICVDNLGERVRQLESIGVDCISVHTGVDMQVAGRTPLKDLAEIKSAAQKSIISVAGGITPATVGEYIKLGADIVIVGGGICHASDPVAVTRELYEKIHEVS